MLVKFGDRALINPEQVASVWLNDDDAVEITMTNGDLFTDEEVDFDEVAAKLNWGRSNA